jgi:hypothetical protein
VADRLPFVADLLPRRADEAGSPHHEAPCPAYLPAFFALRVAAAARPTAA